MKPFEHAFKLLLLTAGLLGACSAGATNLSEQPLNITILARPTVLFGMDDSGSMDAEVLIDGTEQGWVYGNTTNATLYPSGARRTGSASGDSAMYYLFPNGTGTGNRVYSDASNSGLAIPPTAQMAWTRSSSYNPIYYDPTKTYSPWAPAYVSAAARTYSNALPGAAKSHPALGSTTMALNADLTSSTADWVFNFTAGMIIPTGATSISCKTGSAGTLPYTVTTTNKYCKATITYYPATYWTKQTCVVDGVNCVTNYDGATLKRYEIKAANYGSTAQYNAAMQNFANWFTYYRKRRLLLAAAMGGVLENLTGLRMGVVAFNAQSAPTIYDSDATTAANNGMAVAGKFYVAEGSSATPTHGTYAYMRDQFDTNLNIIKYACQRNASFIITDGFANDSAVTLPSYNRSTYGATTPYQSISAGSLADQALYYFTTTLRADLPAGKVPLGSQAVTNPDPNPNLHINSYAVTLGAKGSIWPTAVSPFTSAPTWPAPVSNTASMIDDLWHATINGRGQMYLATDADSAAAAIQATLADIKSQVGSQTAVAVSTVNLASGDGQAYMATYNPSGWVGDVTANTIDPNTVQINAASNWSAGTLLAARDWHTRSVITSNGSSGNAGGLAFTSANVGVTVNPDSASYTNSQVVDYLRGNRTDEGSLLRVRSSLIGAVINAEPVVDPGTGVVYVASGEGMLHAFSTATGVEQWAFVPYAGLANIGATVERGYAFKTKLDATPSLGKFSDTGKILVGGMGAAGRSYYAIDVTAPTGLTEAQAATKVKWTFPSVTQGAYQTKVGYTSGRPLLVNVTGQGYVALVTSGYDNGETISDGKGRLWMLNADTGAVITEFTTSTGSNAAEAGLAQLAAYREDDGTVKYVYGGDLLGNLWKFDLTAGTTTLLAVLKDASGNTQPITTAPQLTRIGTKRLVLVGTGRLLDTTDFAGVSVQTMYAIIDGTSLANARTVLTPLSRNLTTNVITGNVDWTTSRGWYFDIPASQVINTDPRLVMGRVFFTGNQTGGANCGQSAYGYVVDVMNTTGEMTLMSSNANASFPLVVQSGDKLVRWTRLNDGTVNYKDVSMGGPIVARKNSWKNISK